MEIMIYKLQLFTSLIVSMPDLENMHWKTVPSPNSVTVTTFCDCD